MSPRLTIANALTFSRLILLPVVIIGIATSQRWVTVTAMATVVVTDLLDGRIARRLGQASQFGKGLDSTVDFVLIYSLFIAFYAAGRLETYQFAIIYAAMLTILSVQLLAQSGGTGDSPAAAKLVGALEYVFLLLLTVREALPDAPVLAALSLGLFLVLAGAIGLNAIACIRAIASALRSAPSAGPGGDRSAG